MDKSMQAPRVGRKTYRIALYGPPSSGKTCLLAALASPRPAHPLGLTTTWVREHPDGAPRPDGQAAEWKTEDPFWLGIQWLDEQTANLAAGKRPPPNPNRADPVRYLFDFGCPTRGARRVELDDYSGEMLHLADQAEFAKRLQERMREADAVLVLAETPTPNAPTVALSQEFHRLQTAFNALAAGRTAGVAIEHWPAVVLFTKWDRSGPLEGASPELEAERLKSFLASDPEPPQKSLTDAVRNCVGEADFAVFPCSAFDGAPSLTDGKLKSFGLEDAFQWAIDRVEALHDQSNAIETQKLEAAARACSWVNPIGFLGAAPALQGPAVRGGWAGEAPWRIVHAGKALESRLPLSDGRSDPAGLARNAAVDELRRRAGAAVWVGRLKFVSQTLASLATAAILILLLEFEADRREFAAFRAVAGSGTSSDATLDDAVRRLSAYQTSPSWRHILHSFLVSRREAEAQVRDLQSRRDEDAWKVVTELLAPAADDAGGAKPQYDKAAQAAEQYLNRFPTGKHSTEAELSVKKAAFEKSHKESSRRLDELKEELERSAASNDPIAKRRALSDIRDRMDGLLILGSDAALQARRTELQAKVAEGLDGLSRAEREEELRRLDGEISRIRARFAKARSLAMESQTRELENLLNEAGKLGPTAVALEAQEAQGKLVAEIQQALHEAAAQVLERKKAEARADVVRKLDEGRPHLALDMLREKEVQLGLEAVQDLRRIVRERTPDVVSKRVDEALRYRDWGKARSAVEESRRNDGLIRLLGGDLAKKLDAQARRVDEAEDEALYEVVRARGFWCRKEAEDYLKVAPLQVMRKPVEQYKAYLDGLAQGVDVAVSLDRVEWHARHYGNFNAYRHQVKVAFDGEAALAIPRIDAYPNQVTRQLGAGSVRVKVASASHRVQIEVMCVYGALADSVQWTKVKEEQANFKSADAEVAFDVGEGDVLNKFVVKLKLPSPPALPSWRAK